jgi:SNF2 family DNA or RNA helicase
MSSNPQIISEGGSFRLIDSEDRALTERKIIRVLEKYASYFEDYDQLILRPSLNYVELQDFIDKLSSRLAGRLEIGPEIVHFISQNAYAIEEQRIAGLTIKDYDDRWNAELEHFNAIVSQEISRPLKPQQVQASFFLAMMKKAANFSVPGAGKTAMMYGAFAYLSSPQIDEVNKMVVVSPINAFESWRAEYVEVFGSKRKLHFMNMKDYSDLGSIRTHWGIADVIVINYESLQGKKLTALNALIDSKTMIVFDEVHRIKGTSGKRAQNALELGPQARYHYVLTGTPIPNSYKDIYNFLHLLYRDEYDNYFGWEVNELANPDTREVNERLQPFFWRTNKTDLKVPPADPDELIHIEPSQEQMALAKVIYKNESNVLGRYIRLLQASTNPSLITDKIDLTDLGFLIDEIDFNFDEALTTEEEEKAKKRLYLDLNVDKMRTPKFDMGIRLINDLVSQGKKVIVWGMFVGTMNKIYKELSSMGIRTHLIYGGTPKNSRVGMINDFRDGDVQVLISNPATLGESISLHQTVHDAVYFEYNFNLTFMLQSRDRIHRLGLADDQYTHYYYLMTDGDSAHEGFIDKQVYNRLKEKEEVMLNAIDGDLLVPMIEDDYLEDVKKLLG